MRYCAAILTLAMAMAVAGLAVEDDPVPRPKVVAVKWQLEFEYKTPQTITLKLAGEKKPLTFWYVLYQVTNRTKGDRIYAPEFVMYTDTGEIVRAGQKVSSAVFEAIQKRHNNPLLLDIAGVTGRLLQGEDNAKDGVAIWRDFDPKARGFDLFIGGLSGERETLPLPVPIKVRDAKGKEITKTETILSKTLQLTYSVPGEAAARPRVKPALLNKTWVMR